MHLLDGPMFSQVAWGAAAGFLAASAWKATIVLMAAFAASFILRRASASFRHLVWSAAVICLLLLPAASFVLPGLNVETPAGWASARTAQPARAAEPTGTGERVIDLSAPHGAASPARGESGFPPSAVILLAIWAAGFCLVMTRIAIGIRRVRSLARGATELDDHEWIRSAAQLSETLALGRPVVMLRSARVSIPMTAGVLRPVILLPAVADTYPADRRWIVLAHELLHVGRADYVLWMMARVACAVYWFHPLVWLAALSLRREAEQACDDGVLRLGAAAPAYAEQLVSMVRGWSVGNTAESSAMAMAQPSHLESRIRALLDPTRDRRAVSRASIATVALAAVLMLAPLAAVRARAQTAVTVLHGAVSDISGARLPGAFVTLQRAGDSSEASATTSDSGEFEFTSLPAGDYVIEIRKPGFRVSQQPVRVEGGTRQSLELTLPLGSVYETINIVGKSSSTSPRPAGPPRRIRVGGNVQQSKLVTMIQPAYPDDLQREGIEGMVVLEAVILVDGSLGNLRLAGNLVAVDQRLVAAAMEGVRFWRYAPTLLNGEPVEVITTITINFQLEH